MLSCWLSVCLSFHPSHVCPYFGFRMISVDFHQTWYLLWYCWDLVWDCLWANFVSFWQLSACHIIPHCVVLSFHVFCFFLLSQSSINIISGLDGSVGCAVRLETRRSWVQPLPRSATFFRGDWSWNIFYGHSLPSADSRRAVVSFWRKNVHNTG